MNTTVARIVITITYAKHKVLDIIVWYGDHSSGKEMTFTSTSISYNYFK